MSDLLMGKGLEVKARKAFSKTKTGAVLDLCGEALNEFETESLIEYIDKIWC